MADLPASPARRAASLALLRELRRCDEAIGVKNSGIARDIILLLYEVGATGLSVNDITASTGYTGPTARLVLERLRVAGSVVVVGQRGKTQLYTLTEQGRAGCDSYVAALLDFAATVGRSPAAFPVSLAAAPAPGRGRQADLPPPPARHAGAPPAREAAD